jgi:hypothetical protein
MSLLFLGEHSMATVVAFAMKVIAFLRYRSIAAVRRSLRAYRKWFSICGIHQWHSLKNETDQNLQAYYRDRLSGGHSHSVTSSVFYGLDYLLEATNL